MSEAHRPLLWRSQVTPNLAVAVDEALCTVLDIAEGTGTRHTVSNVAALCEALGAARGYVTVHEAVMADHTANESKGWYVQASGYYACIGS
jgi:hypothetical protein